MTIHITGGPFGAWSGGAVVIDEPTTPTAQQVTVVDKTDPQAMAAWKTATPTPAESAAAIRARIARVDFEDRTAREGRDFDPRDDEPTDYDR